MQKIFSASLGVICAIGLCLGCQFVYAKQRAQISPVQVAKDDSPAVLQIVYLGENGQHPEDFNVDGTGFLVGRDGYFITAAHVLARYKASTAQLTATMHQRDKSGGGL